MEEKREVDGEGDGQDQEEEEGGEEELPGGPGHPHLGGRGWWGRGRGAYIVIVVAHKVLPLVRP